MLVQRSRRAADHPNGHLAALIGATTIRSCAAATPTSCPLKPLRPCSARRTAAEPGAVLERRADPKTPRRPPPQARARRVRRKPVGRRCDILSRMRDGYLEN
jgi:hypothetical protein